MKRRRCVGDPVVVLAVGLLVPGTRSMYAQGAGRGTVRQAPATPGAVTGHVTLEDTGGPARFASVMLQPVVLPATPLDAAKSREDQGGARGPVSVSRVVHTGLDGSFLVPGVAPGNYYVMVDYEAYVSAAGLLTREQMDHPTKEIVQQMTQLLAAVSVASGKTSTTEVRLHRGASLSGTVRFDDGTPFKADVRVERRNDKGEWKEFRPYLEGGSVSVDDQGQFRAVGLPAGSYRMRADLSAEDDFVSRRGDQTEGWMSRFLYSLKIYSPDATREKNAKVFQLTDGQEEAGVQIQVPLSKLHAVSGSLVEKGSGRTINAGHVSVVYADDGTELASTEVNGDDDAFHLAFVPEGSYTLKITSAQDVERTEVPNAPGAVPPFETKQKTVRSFGEAAQPLVVTSDVQGVLVAVPPATPTSAGAAAAASAVGANALP